MHSTQVIDVVARCIARRDEAPKRPEKPAKVVHGCINGLPKIGRSLVIYRRGDAGRLITTPVVRMLIADGEMLYVETSNSVYRIALCTPMTL
jgi:hypothetical protein